MGDATGGYAAPRRRKSIKAPTFSPDTPWLFGQPLGAAQQPNLLTFGGPQIDWGGGQSAAATTRSPFGPAPRTPASSGTPTQKKSLLEQLIEAQQGVINSTYTQSAADAQAQADRVNAIYQGAAQAIQRMGIPQAVQGAYQGAGNQTASYSQGYSQAMQQELNKSGGQINADLAATGAPAGQQVDPAKAEAAANVLYGLTGAIPARTLSQQGASAFDYYSGIPAAEIGFGARESADTLASLLAKAGSDRTTAQAELNAKIPEWKMQQESDDTKTKLDLIKFNTTRADKLNSDEANRALSVRRVALSEAQAAYNNLLLAKKFGLDSKQYQLAVGRYNLAVQKAQVAEQKVSTSGTPYYVDPATGELQLKPNYTTNQQGQIVPRYKPATPKPAKAVKPPKVLASSIKGGAQAAQQAFNGWYTLPGDGQSLSASDLRQVMNDHPGSTLRDLFDQGIVDHKYATYQETLQQILALGVPLSRAQRMLNRYWTKGAPGAKVVDGFILMPWEKPGQGRPLVPFQKRQKPKAR